MRIVDVNVLINAANEDAPAHRSAVAWLRRALGGGEAVGFDITVILGYVRISTNPRAMARPLSPADAFADVGRWLEAPAATRIAPGRDHLATMERLLAGLGAAGNLVADAHLAALAVDLDAAIATFDRDFVRFPGVRVDLLA